MEVKAKAKFIKMSPRKVRLVLDVVRGLSVAEAQKRLTFLNKDAATPVLKLINSAAANAEHNFNLKIENLMIKTIQADGGPTIKRWKPRARGRAFPIRKRTSHITVVLVDKDAKEEPVAKVESTKKPMAKKPTATKTTAKAAVKKTETKQPAAKATPKKKTAAKETKKESK